MNQSNVPPDLQEQARQFVTFLSRHLVCMGVHYVWLDSLGKPTGDPFFYGASGFVISFHDEWFFVTAGHVFKDDIEPNLKDRKIAITASSFADYFGPDAKVQRPTAFDYESMPKYFIDDREYGLDLALVHLRPFYRSSLAANGVIAVTEENWLHQDAVSFDVFRLLGFPATEARPYKGIGDFGEEWVSASQPASVAIKRLDDMPDDIEKSDLPWFIGELPSEAIIKSVKGISGGPILGFQLRPQLRYWIVAMQSRQIGRIILGCPVPVFMDILEEALGEIHAQIPPRARNETSPSSLLTASQATRPS